MAKGKCTLKARLLALSSVCAACGKELTYKSATLDRIVPGALGGGYVFKNVRLTCAECNNSKGCNAVLKDGRVLGIDEFILLSNSQIVRIIVELAGGWAKFRQYSKGYRKTLYNNGLMQIGKFRGKLILNIFGNKRKKAKKRKKQAAKPKECPCCKKLFRSVRVFCSNECHSLYQKDGEYKKSNVEPEPPWAILHPDKKVWTRWPD